MLVKSGVMGAQVSSGWASGGGQSLPWVRQGMGTLVCSERIHADAHRPSHRLTAGGGGVTRSSGSADPVADCSLGCAILPGQARQIDGQMARREWMERSGKHMISPGLAGSCRAPVEVSECPSWTRIEHVYGYLARDITCRLGASRRLAPMTSNDIGHRAAVQSGFQASG